MIVAVLVVGGLVYRAMAERLELTGNDPIQLPLPLAHLPYNLGAWTGEDLEIRGVTQHYMRTRYADDFVSRRYRNARLNARADFYAVYCASRPGGILGHNPTVCYPSAGWVVDESQPADVRTASGRDVPCLIHRMHQADGGIAGELAVLSFYVVNGRVVRDEAAFSGLLGRRPNLNGDPARYVANVQISSDLESAVRAAASDMAEAILALLPDEATAARVGTPAAASAE